MDNHDSDGSSGPCIPEDSEVWVTQPVVVPQPTPTVYTRTDLSSTSSPRKVTPTLSSCFYCKKVGHVKSECWRYNRRCLACGSSEHRIAQCPRRRGASGAGSASPPRRVSFASANTNDVRGDMLNSQAPASQGTPRRS